jgi:hypothetical protein
MVNRYVSVTDVEEHLETGTLTETTTIKRSIVERWITAAEQEVDDLTLNRWDLHTVEGELITPDCQSQDFYVRNRPLKRIISLEYQNGDEWTSDWKVMDSANYRVINNDSGKFRTKDFYWMEEGLRINYECGFDLIPLKIQELTLLLTEKRYIMTRLGISASSGENVSVASIRIQDKSNSSLSYRVDGLQKEIDDRLKRIKSMKSKNAVIGFVTLSQPNKRYRMW